MIKAPKHIFIMKKKKPILLRLTDADRAYMVIILGFLEAESPSATLKAVPSGL